MDFNDITFFKTSQGSKYIRMSDGRLRRWKSYHSSTGGEDQGLHSWSNMSVFVAPQYDKEANSPQFLIDKGYKIGLSKTKNGKMVVVIFDVDNWRPATWGDAYPVFVGRNPEYKDKPLAWEYVKEPKVGYHVVDFKFKDGQLKSYHFGSDVSEIGEFGDDDKKLFFPSYFKDNNLQEEITRIKQVMGLLSEDDDKHIIAYKGVKQDFDNDKEGPMFFTKFYDGARHYANVIDGKVLQAKLKFKNPLIVNAYSVPGSGYGNGIPIYADEEDKSTFIGTFSDYDINDKITGLGYDGLIINKKYGEHIDGWEILSFSKNNREFIDI